MANFHLYSQSFLPELTFDQDKDMILEIGSDQNEGSTAFFNGLALNYDVPFYTVDVVDDAKKRFVHLENTTWQIEQGSTWTKTVLPTLNKKIKVLYLDNYDWSNPGPNADRLKEEYASRGVEWSNLGSQIEHIAQMINCLPYMADNSLVICDDTPLQDHSGIYIGKCGAVVPFLLASGFRIRYAENNGIILSKGV